MMTGSVGVKRKKTSKGRQKIAIKRIEKEDSRQICFSKRRSGIFKKATELSILCGAEVVIVVFSPVGKPFSFEHPSVAQVANRFLSGGGASSFSSSSPSTDRTQQAKLAEMFRYQAELVKLVEAERKRRDSLEEKLNGWAPDDIEGMGLDQLQDYLKALEQLKLVVQARANELAGSRAIEPFGAAAMAGNVGVGFAPPSAWNLNFQAMGN